MGRTGRPSYRIVAADARKPRDGRIIANLGFYEPCQPEGQKQLELNVERAKYWVDNGAEATRTVASILAKHGVKARTK